MEKPQYEKKPPLVVPDGMTKSGYKKMLRRERMKARFAEKKKLKKEKKRRIREEKVRFYRFRGRRFVIEHDYIIQ